MKLKLEFNCDNSAFNKNRVDLELEIARILENLAKNIRNGNIYNSQTIIDLNGNNIGQLKIIGRK